MHSSCTVFTWVVLALVYGSTTRAELPDSLASILDGLLTPQITEIVPFFNKSTTTITQTGTYTFGSDCSAISITASVIPTTCTYTGIGTKTITYPADTPTTITTSWWEPTCTCSKTTIFPWKPTPTHTSSCKTVTATVTISKPASSCPSTISTVTVTQPGSTCPVTTTSSTTSSTSTTSAAASPTFSCAPEGYLIQTASLVSVDIPSGTYTQINPRVGDGSPINALAFNILDNYLYGFQIQTRRVLRISADGSSKTVVTLPSNVVVPSTGEIDTNGYYWFSYSGQSWYQMDLIPNSPTYAQIINRGRSDPYDQTVGDWVYLPSEGQYLFNFGTNNTSGGSSLMRWSMTTHVWQKVSNFPNITSACGAHYGINNGTFFASDNPTGNVFNVPVRGTPFVVAKAPPTNSNDGARCVLNLLV